MSVHNKFYFMMAIMRPPYTKQGIEGAAGDPQVSGGPQYCFAGRGQQAGSATGSIRNTPGGWGTNPPPNQGHVPSHVKLLVTPKWVVVYNIVLLAETNKQDQQLVPVGTKVVEVNLSPHQGHVPSHVSVAIHAMQVRPRCP